eukprot:COSAG02_NODE_26_length_51927_cov_61.213881_28_plen_69_part_00
MGIPCDYSHEGREFQWKATGAGIPENFVNSHEGTVSLIEIEIIVTELCVLRTFGGVNGRRPPDFGQVL